MDIKSESQQYAVPGYSDKARWESIQRPRHERKETCEGIKVVCHGKAREDNHYQTTTLYLQSVALAIYKIWNIVAMVKNGIIQLALEKKLKGSPGIAYLLILTTYLPPFCNKTPWAFIFLNFKLESILQLKCPIVGIWESFINMTNYKPIFSSVK